MISKDQQRLFEMLAALLTGVGKFVFMDWLNMKFVFIAAAIVFWTTYVFYRKRQDPKVLSYWGFTTHGFRSTFLELLPYGIGCTALFVTAGYYFETSVLNWTIIPILLLYPLWGIIQQFLVVSLMGKNLHDFERWSFGFGTVVFITALFFGIVHYPYWLLIGGTFLLAIVYTILYLKGRNLLVLGIYHGWLGALFFYTVLGRDCWQEVFAVLGS